MTLFIGFSFATIACLLVVIFFAYDTIVHGIKTRRERKKGVVNAFWYEYHLGFHKKCAWWFFATSIVLVFLIEGTRGSSHKHIVYGALFWWHLCLCALPFITLLTLLRFRVLSPAKIGWKHYLAGGLCGATFVGTLVLGGILFYRLMIS